MAAAESSIWKSGFIMLREIYYDDDYDDDDDDNDDDDDDYDYMMMMTMTTMNEYLTIKIQQYHVFDDTNKKCE